MFKNVVSALVVSGVLLSGVAFAADQTAPTQPPVSQQTQASASGNTVSPIDAEKVEKKAHKAHGKKHAAVKSEATKVESAKPTETTTPAKGN